MRRVATIVVLVLLATGCGGGGSSPSFDEDAIRTHLDETAPHLTDDRVDEMVAFTREDCEAVPDALAVRLGVLAGEDVDTAMWVLEQMDIACPDRADEVRAALR